MKDIKQRKWLIENDNMLEVNPKEYYREKFKKLIHEIKMNRIIIENSEICAKVVPVKKLVLLVYPNNAIKVIKINGLKIRAINENMIALKITELIFDTSMLNPRIIKKIIKKKSLRGLIFDVISIL